MFETQWLLALSGGMLVGLSALILMLFNGRVAGISGILAGALQHRHAWRWLFLLGLGAGAWLAFSLGWARMPSFSALPTWPLVALAGLLVGWGMGAAEPAMRVGAYGFNSALTAIVLSGWVVMV